MFQIGLFDNGTVRETPRVWGRGWKRKGTVVRVCPCICFQDQGHTIRLLLREKWVCVWQLVIFAAGLFLMLSRSCLINRLKRCCLLFHRDTGMVDTSLGEGNVSIGQGSWPSVVRYIPGCWRGLCWRRCDPWGLSCKARCRKLFDSMYRPMYYLHALPYDVQVGIRGMMWPIGYSC